MKSESVLSLIFGQQPLGRIVRLMRQHRGVPEEERLALVGREEVVDRLQALPADFQPFVAVAAAASRDRHGSCRR